MAEDQHGIDRGRVLGRETPYPQAYQPELLEPIERAPLRAALGIAPGAALPFVGVDQWTGYELSWLNLKGRPEVAVLQLAFGADSPCLVESKSLKLYCNSLNQQRFADHAAVTECVRADLSAAAGAPVGVRLLSLATLAEQGVQLPGGDCLDTLDVTIDCYQLEPSLLALSGRGAVRRRVHSNLLRSCCPVTGQPDWGTLIIDYAGPEIEPASLLRYLVSFRDHSGFHEETVERIFLDLQACCQPEMLQVEARYLRRGGLDISPLRSSHRGNWVWQRDIRQ